MVGWEDFHYFFVASVIFFFVLCTYFFIDSLSEASTVALVTSDDVSKAASRISLVEFSPVPFLAKFFKLFRILRSSSFNLSGRWLCSCDKINSFLQFVVLPRPRHLLFRLSHAQYSHDLFLSGLCSV